MTDKIEIPRELAELAYNAATIFRGEMQPPGMWDKLADGLKAHLHRPLHPPREWHQWDVAVKDEKLYIKVTTAAHPWYCPGSPGSWHYDVWLSDATFLFNIEDERKAREAEIARQAAERAAREAQEKAAQAEAERLAKEAAEKDQREKRERNARHRAKIKQEAIESLATLMQKEEDIYTNKDECLIAAAPIIEWIDEGQVSHVTLNYGA